MCIRDRAGADCVSCLTEPKWFLGSDEIFQKVRGIVTRPMIRKDFTVDVYKRQGIGNTVCIAVIIAVNYSSIIFAWNLLTNI